MQILGGPRKHVLNVDPEWGKCCPHGWVHKHACSGSFALSRATFDAAAAELLFHLIILTCSLVAFTMLNTVDWRWQHTGTSSYTSFHLTPSPCQSTSKVVSSLHLYLSFASSSAIIVHRSFLWMDNGPPLTDALTVVYAVLRFSKQN